MKRRNKLKLFGNYIFSSSDAFFDTTYRDPSYTVEQAIKKFISDSDSLIRSKASCGYYSAILEIPDLLNSYAEYFYNFYDKLGFGVAEVGNNTSFSKCNNKFSGTHTYLMLTWDYPRFEDLTTEQLDEIFAEQKKTKLLRIFKHD